MNYDRTQRIRRAAILVASLEETLAEQMLESLPRLEATRILDEVDRLGELDPEELQDVLDEFRSAGRRGHEIEGGVEFTYSAPMKPILAATAAVASPGDAEAADADARQADNALLMAELLSHEHPQTIAAALSVCRTAVHLQGRNLAGTDESQRNRSHLFSPSDGLRFRDRNKTHPGKSGRGGSFAQ